MHLKMTLGYFKTLKYLFSHQERYNYLHYQFSINSLTLLPGLEPLPDMDALSYGTCRGTGGC